MSIRLVPLYPGSLPLSAYNNEKKTNLVWDTHFENYIHTDLEYFSIKLNRKVLMQFKQILESGIFVLKYLISNGFETISLWEKEKENKRCSF